MNGEIQIAIRAETWLRVKPSNGPALNEEWLNTS
jgi:hypothetical protein